MNATRATWLRAPTRTFVLTMYQSAAIGWYTDLRHQEYFDND